MWYMHYGAGVSPSDAIEDVTNNARKQPVDLTEDDQVNYEQHAANAYVVTAPNHADSGEHANTAHDANQGGVPHLDTQPTRLITGTTADEEMEPEPETADMEIRTEREQELRDSTVVELDQDTEWNQIQPFVRPTQRSQDKKLNDGRFGQH